MYKGASQGLQRRLRVSSPLPTGGYIGGAPDALDTLAPTASLTMDAAKDEKARLQREIQQCEQEVALGKVQGREHLVRAAGQRKAVLQARQSAVNNRIKELNVATNGDYLSAAIRDVVDAETAARIFTRAGEIRRDRDVSLAEDAKRLSPEGVAARAEGIAQTTAEESHGQA